MFKFIVTLITCMASTPIFAEPYVSVNITSIHVGPYQGYNDNNFGLSVGYLWPTNSARFGVEGGFYNNSHNNNTNYVLASIDWPIFNDKAYIGVFTGLFEYSNLVNLADKFNIPRINNYILDVGINSTIAVRNMELVTRVAYGSGHNTYAIFGFQIRYNF